MRKILELGFITILFLFVCFVYQNQPRISHQNGQGWDGAFYYSMTEQIMQGNKIISGELPFVKRIGTPFLIAEFSMLSGRNVLDSALIVNLIGTYLTVILLFFWLGFYFRNFWLKCFLCFLLMMAWYVPLRMSFYEPMTSDAWGAFLFMGGLLLITAIRDSIKKRKKLYFIGYLIAFSLVVSVGILFRESNSVLAIALIFVLNPFKALPEQYRISPLINTVKEIFKNIWYVLYNRLTIFLFLPLLFVVFVNVLLTKHIEVAGNEYSYIKALFYWFYNKSLPENILGIFNSYGPLLLLLPFYFKEIKAVLFEKQELIILLLLSFFFGFFAGADTERIFFMSSFPIIFLWLGFSIRNIYNSSKRWWFFVLLFFQTFAFRFYWNLPDFPNDFQNTPFPFFSLIGSHFQYLFLYSYHGQYVLNTLLFTEYIFLFFITWYVLKIRGKKKGLYKNTTPDI